MLPIGTGSAEACADVVSRCTGRKFLSIASTPVSFAGLADERRAPFALPRLLAQLVAANVALQINTRRRGIRTKFILGTSLKANEVSTAIYQDFLPTYWLTLPAGPASGPACFEAEQRGGPQVSDRGMPLAATGPLPSVRPSRPGAGGG